MIEAAAARENFDTVEEHEGLRREIHKKAWRRCKDSHLVFMVNKFKSRHTRKKKTKKKLKQKQYTSYVGWNMAKDRRQLQSDNHNGMAIEEIDGFDEELQFVGLNASKSKRLSKQREMLRRLVNVQAITNVQYNDENSPWELK